MKKWTVFNLIVVGLLIFLPIFFIAILPNFLVTVGTQDVDLIRNGDYAGNYLVTNGAGKVQIISPTSDLLWETTEPVYFVHDADMMPDGKSILVADTGADRVFVMNLSDKVILWDWYAKNNTHDTYTDYWNWTDFALQEGFGSESIAIFEDFSPANGYYTHLNTVQFINGTLFNQSYDSILISIRDFDMVVEVNYTAQQGEPGYMNITWYYGIPGNHSILNHQHAPKRWLNGHTTICDSENGRIVEIDENNSVNWIYTDELLRWPRDCEILSNGNYLITDSSNNRIIEVNRTTEQIVRSFTSPLLFVPYEADYAPEDNTVITGNNQQVLIFDYDSGKIINVIGFPFFYMGFASIFMVGICHQTADFIRTWRKMPQRNWKKRLKSFNIYNKLILIGLMVGFIILFNYVWAFLWHYGIWNFLESLGIFVLG